MRITLTKPIAFFDLETTGINIINDRIVEFSVLKIHPDASSEILTKRINPCIPIPAESSAVHGIFQKDIEEAPTFKQIAHELAHFLDNCDLAGYNSNKFDIPLLIEEFLRADVEFEMKNRRLVDVQTIFHKMEQRNLSAAVKFYCGKEMQHAHSAEADIRATYEVFQAQLEKYPELQKDINFLHTFSSHTNNADLSGKIVYNEKNEEMFNFGKHKGRLVEEIFKKEPSYYDWMMKGEFPLHTKKVITAIRLKSFNQK
jgi:DNA polymerase-3 subunit epsilon